MNTKEDIKSIIEQKIENSKVIVNGDDGVHFDAIVISEEFNNIRAVARQQMVYKALGDKFQTGDIHALSLKTYTPMEWQKK